MAADQGVRYCSACGKYHTADAANAFICPHCGHSAAQPINNASVNPSSSPPPVPNRDMPNQGVRYCGACGAPNPGNASFCNKCGQPVMAFDTGIQLDATEIKPADAGTSSESSFPFQQAARSQYSKPVGLNRTPVIVAILLSAITLGYCLQVKVLSHMSSTRISVARGGKGSVAAYTPYFHEPFAPTHGCRYAMRLMRLCNMAAVRLA